MKMIKIINIKQHPKICHNVKPTYSSKDFINCQVLAFSSVDLNDHLQLGGRETRGTTKTIERSSRREREGKIRMRIRRENLHCEFIHNDGKNK